jgi:hypothetical protein
MEPVLFSRPIGVSRRWDSMASLQEITRMDFAFFNILPKKGSLLSESLESAQRPFLIYIAQIRTVLVTRKDGIINIGPNRDDSNHVLIVMIDGDLGDKGTIRASFIFIIRRFQSARSIVIL